MLVSQRCVFNKRGLGYQPKKNKKYLNLYTLLKPNNYMIQTKHEIIMEALVAWFMHVLWRRKNLVIWLGLKNEPP